MRSRMLGVLVFVAMLSFAFNGWAGHDPIGRVNCRFPEKMSAAFYGKVFFTNNEPTLVRPGESTNNLVHLEGLEVHVRPFEGIGMFEPLRLAVSAEVGAHWDVHDRFEGNVVALYPLDMLGQFGTRLCGELGTGWKTNLGSTADPAHGIHRAWIGARFQILDEIPLLTKPFDLELHARYFLNSTEPLAPLRTEETRVIGDADTLRGEIGIQASWRIRPWLVLWTEHTLGVGNEIGNTRYVVEEGLRFPIYRHVELELGAREMIPTCSGCQLTTTGWLGVRFPF